MNEEKNIVVIDEEQSINDAAKRLAELIGPEAAKKTVRRMIEQERINSLSKMVANNYRNRGKK